MNGLTYFCKPRRRGGKIVLVVALATALLVIAAVATGCGSAKAKGVRGTDISYVKVMPSGDALTSGLTKMIKVPTNHDNLAFVVGVENGGDYLEQNIKVTLVIYQHPTPIRRVLTIGQINSKTTKEVIFKGPFNLTEFINKIPIKVDVAPVSGETNLVNNHYTYRVRFIPS